MRACNCSLKVNVIDIDVRFVLTVRRLSGDPGRHSGDPGHATGRGTSGETGGEYALGLGACAEHPQQPLPLFDDPFAPAD